MRSTKMLGAAVAAASMLMALGAGSASAANWDPANTTLTAEGTLTLDAQQSGARIHCTYHSGVRSAGGADAFTTEPGGTTPAPPTLSGCTASNTPVPVTVTGSTALTAWTITATSTTSLDVTGNADIRLDSILGACTIVATDANVAATWNNAAGTATPLPTVFSIDSSGACLGDTTAVMTGSVRVTGANLT